MPVIDVPLQYHANYIPARCTKPRKVPTIARIPVMIMEITPAEAPVLAVMSAGPGQDPWVYREIAGRLARSYSAGMQVRGCNPSRGRMGAVNRTVRGIEATRADFDAWWRSFGADPVDAAVDACPGLLPERLDDRVSSFVVEDRALIRAYRGDNRDANAERLLAHLTAGAAFVDGILFVPSSGPALDPAYSYMGGSVVPMIHPEWSLCGREHRFFAHDADLLDDMCRSGDLFGGRCGELGGLDRHGIDIPDPGALSRAVSAWPAAGIHMELRNLTIDMIEAASPLVGGWRPDEIRTFAALKDVICNGQKGRSFKASLISLAEVLDRCGQMQGSDLISRCYSLEESAGPEMDGEALENPGMA